MGRDIAFKKYKKKYDIHGTVLYPAVMVAPVQKSILSDLINEKQHIRIFDPFHGSGTSLYEAMEVSNNVQLIGCDINPLANLITRVKLQGVSENIKNDIEQIKTLLQEPFNSNVHYFPNINKWFRDDIILSLSHIRNCVTRIEDQKNRLFFWCMLSDIIRKYSNTRSSTYKLHTKPKEDINKIENNAIKDFVKSLETNYEKFNKNCKNFMLYKGDSLSFIKDFKDNEFDICITSPPYGDNNTTVPYGQFSILSLQWIRRDDLELEGWEFENYSIIDSKSLGGVFSKISDHGTNISILDPYVKSISLEKQKKVLRYFKDYFVFLDEVCRVTNTYIIMTLGNRTVDGVKINLTEITGKYLTQKGFSQKETLERDIVCKRIPKKVSCVRNNPVSSMNKEYVIVMEKVK